MSIWDWLKGPTAEDHWKKAQTAAEVLDHAVKHLIKPESYQKVFLPITFHLCGFDRLKQESQHDWMFTGGTPERPDIFLLSGELPNGKNYVPPWATGHEVGHMIDRALGYGKFDADHMCEGLE